MCTKLDTYGFISHLFNIFFSAYCWKNVCQNGGHCVGPDVCACRSGWEGKYCRRRKSVGHVILIELKYFLSHVMQLKYLLSHVIQLQLLLSNVIWLQLITLLSHMMM